MKKRVVPFETVEDFLNLLHIIFYNKNPQPDYDQIRDIFFTDSFDVECEEESEVNE